MSISGSKTGNKTEKRSPEEIQNELQAARARSVEHTVREIVDEVRTNGDQGLKKLVTGFGDMLIPGFKLSPEQIEAEIAKVSADTKKSIGYAHDNIKSFAEAVMRNARPIKLDHGEFTTGLEFRPVQRVGCYVPGGRYPLPSTALMTTITARVAGVEEIVVATPALCPESIYAASLSGVTEIYILGGAQAVAALALGTESIKKVDMVVGPGNLYVTEAKRQLLGSIGIDMLAGPSEIAVIADDTASARWLALDLVSQAEHGEDARAILLTPSQTLADAIKVELENLAAELNENIESLNSQVTVTVLPSIEACIEKCNELAPEHLEIHTDNPDNLKPQLKHYGTILLGSLSTVPYGDYAAGPNHTLPTNKAARFSGALNPFTFLRAQTWLKVNAGASELPTNTMALAHVEGLRVHKLAAEARLNCPLSNNADSHT